MTSFWRTRKGREEDCMEGRQRDDWDDWDDLLLTTLSDGLKSDSRVKGNKYHLHDLVATTSTPNSTAASVVGV